MPLSVRSGARDAWEMTLFGRAYHMGAVPTSERPKYGALELVRFPDGPIPRFGRDRRRDTQRATESQYAVGEENVSRPAGRLADFPVTRRNGRTDWQLRLEERMSTRYGCLRGLKPTTPLAGN
jgi:hypothetical protein